MKNLYEMLEDEYKLNSFSKKDKERAALAMLAKHSKLRFEEQKKNVDSDKPKTFTTGYTPQQLDTIRVRLIKEKIIGAISDDDFKYLFSGEVINNEMKHIVWKASMPLCHLFLSEVVYHKDNFNFKQVNECINFSSGNKLKHNHKSRSQWRNIEILKRILNI